MISFDHTMKAIPAKLGRYQIVREIGRGAMGVVYKAHDPIIEREVAIKAIELAFQVTAEEKQIYLNRFYREAKAAGKLNHANIVTIYDVDEDKETGIPFIVMEYLEGTTLQEIIAGGILLPLEDVNSIITQVADALSYAHNQSVVHRDVKSANVILLSGMKAKIMDFGIARLPSSDLTKSGQFMGTPNYMSPEQVEGRGQVDGRSDLFSLGIIFYMLLTGERPFSGDTFTAVSYKIAHVDPLPPRTINPTIPESYNRVLGKLLTKDPSKRYQNGAELVQDLKRMVSLSPMEQPVAEEVTVISESNSVSASSDQLLDSDSRDRTPTKSIGDSVASKQQTITIFRTRHFQRLAIALGIVAVLVTGAAVLTHKPDDPQSLQNPAVAIPPGTKGTSPAADPKVEMIHSKLDLAVNYFNNGFYDQSIHELNEVLDLDPHNSDAKRYLDLARKRKIEEKEKEKAAQKD